MTRINATIPVQNLVDSHLLAEAREIKRVPNVIKSGRFSLEGIPPSFVLGTGHVKFFYNKQGFLLNRYKQLFEECVRRGFQVTDFSEAWKDIPSNLMGGWKGSGEANHLIKERICERLAGMKNIHYLGQRINFQKAKELLWHN